MKRIIFYLILYACLTTIACAGTNSTVTRGYTFGSTETVTNTKLHSLVDSADITGLKLGAFGSTIRPITISATAPSSPSEGDFWYDTSTLLLKQSRSSAWVIIPNIVYLGAEATDPDTVASQGILYQKDIYDSTIADTIPTLYFRPDGAGTPQKISSPVNLTGDQSIAGDKTFSDSIIVSGNTYLGTVPPDAPSTGLEMAFPYPQLVLRSKIINGPQIIGKAVHSSGTLIAPTYATSVGYNLLALKGMGFGTTAWKLGSAIYFVSEADFTDTVGTTATIFYSSRPVTGTETENMRITGSGNVGIGTIGSNPGLPEDKFQVFGKATQYLSELTDFDTGALLPTTLYATSYGMLIVRDSVDGVCGIFRIEGNTIASISANAAYSTTKGTNGKYNVYFESTDFYIQNMVGNNKNTRVGFVGID